MAVVLDSVSTAPLTNTVSSKTWAHTVSGANRLLLVWVMWNQPSNSETISSVTYNGVGLTQVGSNVVAGGSGLDRCVALYRLYAPSTGTNNIIVTMSAALSFFAAGESYTGAHQTAGLGTPVTATTTSAASLATTVTAHVGSLVASAIAVRTTSTLTVPTTSEWNTLIGTNNCYGGAIQTGATSVTATYSWTTADNAALIAVEVLAATSLALPTKASILGSALSTLTDNFASADTAKWQATGGGAWPSAITVVSGQLNIAVQSPYNSLEAVNTWDLRNSYGYVQVVQRPFQGGDGSTELGFGVRLDASNNFEVILNGNSNIVWRTKLGGVSGTTGFT